MNPDKINKWLELAKNFAGNDFWSDIFENQRPKDFFAGDPFHDGKQQQTAAIYPAVDILTSDHELIILVDLSGVNKDDVQLSINNEILYVKGVVKPLFPNYTTIAAERFSGSFERPINLPVRVDGQTVKVNANFQNGTLIVRIPLSPAWKKTIDID